MIPAIVLIAIAAALNVTALLVVAFIIAAVWIALVLAVISALGGIFKAALYLYATRGQAPEGFEGADLAGTFTRR